MKNLPLHLDDHLPGVVFVPVPVQRLGHRAELDQEVAGQVFRLDLAPFFFPEADERHLIFAHNDPGIRAADKPPPVRFFPPIRFHGFLSAGESIVLAQLAGTIRNSASDMKDSISYEKCQTWSAC